MRKNVTLAYITNNQERKTSFKKRKEGFFKKLTELCTLCDVEACCILYSAYETGPVVWPNPEAVHVVLERFKTVSLWERIKNTMDQESYNMMRIKKIHDQWYKIHKENNRRKLELYMFQVIAGQANLDCFDIHDAADMNWVINKWLKDVEVQINKSKGQTSEGTSNAAVSRTFADGGFPLFVNEINMSNNQLVGLDDGDNDAGDCEDDVNDDDHVESCLSNDDGNNDVCDNVDADVLRN